MTTNPIDPDEVGEKTSEGIVRPLFGPPVEALKRMWRAVQQRLAPLFGQISGFWRFLFIGPEPDEHGELTPPTKTALILASVMLGVALYSWPLKDILPSWIFVPLALIVLAFAYRGVQYASLRGSGSRWEGWLRQSERRPGLIWWERLGFLLALVLSIWAVVVGESSLLPLTLGMAMGFLVLLGQPPQRRELRTVRIVPPLPPPVDPETEDDEDSSYASEYVDRTFEWTTQHAFGADTHKVALKVHEPTYEHFKSINPGKRWDGDIPQFADYVVPGTSPDVERAAAKLLALSKERRYSTFEEISMALSFVQSILYTLDQDSKELEDYWRYPLETLYDETGDCEDTTILGLSLLRRLGHYVVGLGLPEHAALAVEAPPGTPGQFMLHEGRRLYFCETTARGWRVGEIPSEYTEADMKIVPIPKYQPTEART